MNNISSNPHCSGCGVCAAVCPSKAITLEENNHGFFRPVVKAQICIDCGLCIRKCHEHFDMRLSPVTKCFAVSSLRDTIRQKSSSGGVFSELAETILNKRGVVFAAALTTPYKCEHIEATLLNEINPMRKSKYIESCMEKVLLQIKKRAQNNTPLLFVGTPCQCAAVSMFLGSSVNDNLILCDFICHGVASPGLFRKMLESLTKRIGPIKEVDFRHKLSGEGSFFYIKGTTDEILIPNYTKDFPYAYAAGITIGDDCVNCKYTSTQRCSDITLGDYVGNIPNYNKSTIFINTDKGKILFEQSKDRLQIEEQDLNEVKQKSWHLTKPNQYNSRRDAFFRDYNLPYELLAKKYFTPPSLWQNRLHNLKQKFLHLLRKE